MRKLLIVLVSALVMMGSSAFAVQMKCGAGKCGKSMAAKPAMKCGGMNKMGSMKKDCNCTKCDKEGNMSMKMGGKCGKALPAKPMNKCGSMQKAKKINKCGSK